MSRIFELLAPGGDIDSIKAAVIAGADAIYCGLDRYNARNRAKNINFDDLPAILHFAHAHNSKVFLTLNIILLENEIDSVVKLLNQLGNMGIDGIIVQDLGLFYILSNYFPNIEIHASTQCTTHNRGQIKFLRNFNTERVNLARELNIDEINDLTRFAHENSIETEVFVHGSYCISFSGLCYFSSFLYGSSGNRGRCSQPCRERYKTTATGVIYPFNLKDNCAFSDLKELQKANVDSLKIEGRVKKSHYVYTVVNSYRKRIDNLDCDIKEEDIDELYMVFNRDFSDSYLKGDINKEMFIDNPHDNSIKYFEDKQSPENGAGNGLFRQQMYEKKEENIRSINDIISKYKICKIPVNINFTGEKGTPLKVKLQIQGKSFEFQSETNLTTSESYGIDSELVSLRFKVLKNTAYYLDDLKVDSNLKNLFIPFNELSLIIDKVYLTLTGLPKKLKHVKVLEPPKRENPVEKPELFVLISSKKELSLCQNREVKLFYKLPDIINGQLSEFIEMFNTHPNLYPWFGSILIGDEFEAATRLLVEVKPKMIVADNTGIAQIAFENRIEWIAGSNMNLSNSYALYSLKEKFNCNGAFISDELNKNQIRKIIPPKDFKLCYTIYRPVMLMKTRQCLFHQITGCEKSQIDNECMIKCEKSSEVTNIKGNTFIINKEKSGYHTVYNDKNMLNLEITSDLPGHFNAYMIDLSDIKTKTKITCTNNELVERFQNLLKTGNSKPLEKTISPTTNSQYKKGL